jgi:hypothetical protein
MASHVSMKTSLAVYIVLFFALVAFSDENSFDEKLLKDTEIVSQLINERTNGNDAFYSRALAPAQSLDSKMSKSDRINAVNSLMINEINSILLAFKTATEDKKVEAINRAILNFDGELVKNGGAWITFFDTKPSAAISRSFLMIPKKIKNNLKAIDLLNIVTSYKHSAKQSDYVYEYPDFQNLTVGQVIETKGSENSWRPPLAGAPFQLGVSTALKKCRQILGWRCVTSLYRADEFLTGSENIKILFISSYDLETNPDHPTFAKDKRSANQVSGSTAVYIFKESPEWILFYGVDNQWNEGKLSFQNAIQTEFKKDFLRFKERVSQDLQVSPDLLN